MILQLAFVLTAIIIGAVSDWVSWEVLDWEF